MEHHPGWCCLDSLPPTSTKRWGPGCLRPWPARFWCHPLAVCTRSQGGVGLGHIFPARRVTLLADDLVFMGGLYIQDGACRTPIRPNGKLFLGKRMAAQLAEMGARLCSPLGLHGAATHTDTRPVLPPCSPRGLGPESCNSQWSTQSTRASPAPSASPRGPAAQQGPAPAKCGGRGQ